MLLTIHGHIRQELIIQLQSLNGVVVVKVMDIVVQEVLIATFRVVVLVLTWRVVAVLNG